MRTGISPNVCFNRSTTGKFAHGILFWKTATPFSTSTFPGKPTPIPYVSWIRKSFSSSTSWMSWTTPWYKPSALSVWLGLWERLTISPFSLINATATFVPPISTPTATFIKTPPFILISFLNLFYNEISKSSYPFLRFTITILLSFQHFEKW